MNKQQLIDLAEMAAQAHGLDPVLVKAVCHHESGNWNPWAIRYEPAFYERYIHSMSTLKSETEKRGRAFSYGLTQIMGQTAREFGFGGDYLTELLDPRINLEYGCRKLARCLKNTNGDMRKALLQYNGGGNLAYPDIVMRLMKQYTRPDLIPTKGK
jgi:soluble lytic murein transglycosylase-like protein